MRLAIKIVISCVLLLAAGGFGFYLGVGQGADVMAKLSGQHEVDGALYRLHASVEALKRHNLDYSMQQHRRNLVMALVTLGEFAPAVSGFWTCSKTDASIVGDARDYLQAHPEMGTLPIRKLYPRAELHKALGFCQ